jgi:hypothetical protein
MFMGSREPAPPAAAEQVLLLRQLLDERFSILIEKVLNHLVDFGPESTKIVVEGTVKTTFTGLHEHQMLVI